MVNHQPESGSKESKGHDSRRRLVRCWPIALVAVACGLALWFGVNRPKRYLVSLFVPKSALNLGVVTENSSFQWQLPIRNQSDRSIQIVGFVASCNCVSIEPSRLTIGPGATIKLNLTLDLTKAPGYGTGNSWPFKVNLVPRFQSQNTGRLSWTLRGEVRRLVAVSPAVWKLGKVNIHDPSSRLRSLRIHMDKRIELISAKCLPDLAKVSWVPVNQMAQDFNVKMKLVPKLPHDEIRFYVKFIGKTTWLFRF